MPDRDAWRAGFDKTIAAAPAEPLSFDDAVQLVTEFLDPVLAGPINDHWIPGQGWSPESASAAEET